MYNSLAQQREVHGRKVAGESDGAGNILLIFQQLRLGHVENGQARVNPSLSLLRVCCPTVVEVSTVRWRSGRAPFHTMKEPMPANDTAERIDAQQRQDDFEHVSTVRAAGIIAIARWASHKPAYPKCQGRFIRFSIAPPGRNCAAVATRAFVNSLLSPFVLCPCGECLDFSTAIEVSAAMWDRRNVS
jgi:hypothetical protein